MTSGKIKLNTFFFIYFAGGVKLIILIASRLKKDRFSKKPVPVHHQVI